nr:MAG TPA: hypothetical protein [Caudoviricetes sp.]
MFSQSSAVASAGRQCRIVVDCAVAVMLNHLHLRR